MTRKSSNKTKSPKKTSPGRYRASKGQVVAGGIRPQGIEALYNVHRLGDELFEELSCALWSTDPTVKLPDLYGRKRQQQFGIDVLADRVDGEGIDGISCKCYGTLQKGDLSTFAKEFLDHWESHWKKQNFRRFILSVACDLRARERREEQKDVKEKFSAIGVEFEVWSQRIISNKLHLNEGIRRRFGFYDPVEVITQSIEKAQSPSIAALGDVSVDQSKSLTSALDRHMAARLDELDAERRRGHVVQAAETLEKMQRDATFALQAPEIRARVIRTRAVLRIDSDPATAEALLNEADAIAPESEGRIRALYTFRVAGPAAALERLPPQPTTKEAGLLRAALLLEARQLDEAAEALAHWNDLRGHDSEWHRLSAHHALARNRLSDAIAEIETAERLTPDSVSVQDTATRIHFAGALPPSLINTLHVLPTPAHVSLLRQDPVAREHLHRALTHIDRMSAGAVGARAQHVDLWRLACLAGLSNRFAEANALCHRLLADPSTAGTAVPWALHSGYSMDHQMVIRQLENRLREKPTDVEALQAVVLAAISHHDLKKARAAVARFQTRNPTAPAEVAQWARRIALLSGEVLPDDPSAPIPERVQRLIATSRMSKNWAPMGEFLQKHSLEPGDLFFACALLAEEGQWALVAAHADALLDQLENPAAVHLTAHAWYHTDQFERALNVLNSYEEVFDQGVLPYDLQRLKAYAAAGSGDLKTARGAIASTLAQRQSAQAFQFAIQLALRGGDRVGAATLVKEALLTKTLTPKQALHFVSALASEQPELARQVARDALKQDPGGVNPGWMIPMLYRLGMDEAASALVAQASATNAPSSKVYVASIEDAQRHVQQLQQNMERLNRAYQGAEGPIHAIADGLNRNLGLIWNDVFGRRGAPLFIRSGNRGDQFFLEPVVTPPTLVMDVTALLTVDQLDLWEVLDRAGLRVLLPPSSLLAIGEMENLSSHHQPSRLETLRTVQRLVVERRVHIDDDPSQSDEEHAFVQFDGAELGGVPVGRTVLTLSEIAAYLGDVGDLDRVQFEQLQRRGTFLAADKPSAMPPSLHFVANTVEEIVGAGLFDIVVGRAVIYVDRAYLDHVNDELADVAERERTITRLRALRHRLRDRIDQGMYRLLPQTAVLPTEGPPQSDTMRSLVEMLHVPTQPDHWLWIDDRYCTSFTACNQNNIVSTYEVIDYLKVSGYMTADERVDVLKRLRQANVHILPMDMMELEHALRVAPLNDREIKETPTLKILRHSFNQFLTLTPARDLKPLGPDGRLPEFPSMAAAFGFARKAIEHVWSHQQLSLDQKVAWADWVWSALLVRGVPLDRLDAEQQRRLWFMSIVHLVFIGCALPREVAGATQHDYFHWLESHVPEIAGHADAAAGQFIAKAIVSSVMNPKSPEIQAAVARDRRVLATIASEYFKVVPQALQEFMLPYLAKAGIQLERRPTVNFDNISFDAAHFWNALAATEQGAAVTVTSLDGQRFSVTGPLPTFKISGETQHHLSDVTFRLLSSDSSTRVAGFEDVAGQVSKAAIDRVCALGTPAARMFALHEERLATPAGRYALLVGMLKGRELDATLLQPLSPSSQLEYLGVNDGSAEIGWDGAASRLIEQWGAAEALRRLSALPIPLPGPLSKQVEQESLEVTELARLFVEPTSPMFALHILRSTSCRRDQVMTWRASLARVLNLWTPFARTFCMALQWSGRAWSDVPGWRESSTRARLACVWSHADGVLNAFLRAGLSIQQCSELLRRLETPSVRSLEFHPRYEADVSVPSALFPENLLAQGVGSIELAEPLTESLWEDLFGALSMPGEGRRVLSQHALHDRRAGLNAMQGFLAAPLQAWISADERLLALSDTHRDHLRADWIKQSTGQIQAGATWMVALLMGYQWLPDAERIASEMRFRTFAFPKARPTEDDRLALAGFTRFLPFFDDATREIIRAPTLAWVSELGKIHAGRPVRMDASDAQSMDAHLIVELLFSLIRQRSLERTLLLLAELVIESIQRWPEMSQLWMPMFDRMLDEVPSEAAQPLWTVFTQLRVTSSSVRAVSRAS